MEQDHFQHNNAAAAFAPAAAVNTLPLHEKQPSQPAPVQVEPLPAYPGAKHDVKGYCLHHPKVRLSQPVFADSANAGDGAGESGEVEGVFSTIHSVLFFALTFLVCLNIEYYCTDI